MPIRERRFPLRTSAFFTSLLPLTLLTFGMTLHAPSAGANAGQGGGHGHGRLKQVVDEDSVYSTYDSSVPLLSFAADENEVTSGTAVLLSWASLNTNNCHASGDWDGKQDTDGSYRTEPVDSPRSYTLRCTGSGGGVTETVEIRIAEADTESDAGYDSDSEDTSEDTSEDISDSGDGGDGGDGKEEDDAIDVVDAEDSDDVEHVDDREDADETQEAEEVAKDDEQEAENEEESTANPKLSLAAKPDVLAAGEETTLNWSGEHVHGCEASGAWSGTREPSGQEVHTIAAESNFTLHCDSDTETLMASTTVLILEDGATLTWEAPTETVDGEPLDGLAGYRIYIGPESGNYDQEITLNDPSLDTHFLELGPGEHYIAMTAFDADNRESPFSNEVLWGSDPSN